MKLAAAVNSLEALLAKIGAALQAPVLLVIRLYWGWACAQTGWGKLMNLDRTTGFFASLGIPAPKLNAIAAGVTSSESGWPISRAETSMVCAPGSSSTGERTSKRALRVHGDQRPLSTR